MQSLEETVSILKMEIEQKEAQVFELKKSEGRLNDLSQFNQSGVHSMETTRLLDLEMQNGRFITELTARDEAHEQELKLNTLKFNEVADRLSSITTEKDQAIRILQEKVSILESDLNKKDSLLRNLRDELVETERKKGSPYHSTTHLPPNTSSSAIHQNERVEKDKDESKREIDHLRKHLFDRER